MVQMRKDDKNKQWLVRREEVEVSQYLREERFCFPEKPKAAKSFGDIQENGSEFIREWWKRNKAIAENNKEEWQKIVEQACKGILKEGKLLNQEFEAQLLAAQLLTVKDKSVEEIYCSCIRLYTAESFLYKLVNSTLRNEDWSKVDTLGAYCCLLNRHLWKSRNKQELILYRGCTLTTELFEEYKEAIGKWIKWLGFSSTSKSRQQAEQFGNTLFIIHISRSYLASWQSDISSFSHYPFEQEVLLMAGHSFYVKQVERDPESQKYLIYLAL
ncbi:unnamed protein product [Didymodactylos carnosus]|uniref:ADP ribosyltransferase domain-containing protein n=1 Tax=Didymodactylos carnosus TaxID=1234261 RepID=A0A815E9M8_9BILA|nr:unnamed protein product [Didymodactylos carnosus]CAF1493656.1 unnamed protein product [Didymodactylos carnosus]CAF4149842.1 unnamed protein product [Didymodactylos carnosus]CAF4282729.1 unnamed protein product [Didymodactylos carnosus]